MEENRRLDGRDLMIAFLYYCDAINIGVVIGHKVLLAEEEKIGTRRGSDGGEYDGLGGASILRGGTKRIGEKS